MQVKLRHECDVVAYEKTQAVEQRRLAELEKQSLQKEVEILQVTVTRL